MSLRERGVQHPHVQAKSITELEMFASFPRLCPPHEVAMLEREGFVNGGKLTMKGEAMLRKLTTTWEKG